MDYKELVHKLRDLDCEISREAVAAAIEEMGASEDRDNYWEKRCKNADAQLQELARELQRLKADVSERESSIVILERDNHTLRAQLDIVHLIFGSNR